MEIRCKKEDCKHNTGCSCKANLIDVDRAAHCGSYINNPIKDDIMAENGNIFKVAEEKVAQNLLNVPIECHAKNCLFNKDERCHANGITVTEGEKLADCVTFCGQ